jgi:hypothetical protein
MGIKVMNQQDSRSTAQLTTLSPSAYLLTHLILPSHLILGVLEFFNVYIGVKLSSLLRLISTIVYITKVEFFLAFHTAYNQSITIENAKAGFRGAGLVPFSPQAVTVWPVV